MYFRILLNKNNAFFYNHIWIGVNIQNCLNLKFKSFIEDHILHSELYTLIFIFVGSSQCILLKSSGWLIVSANLLFTPTVTIVEGLKILTECHHFVSENSSNNARGINSKAQQGNRSAVIFFFLIFFFYKITQDYFDQTGELKTCSYLKTSWIVHLPSPW